MTKVVEMKFGSTVYGTTVPDSDVDYKAVFVPSGRDIVMCCAKSQKGGKNDKAKGERNKAGDIDKEEWSLKKYLGLLVEGQTGAFDMLFTPESHYVYSGHTWKELMKNKDKLIHKRIDSFLGYCKAQAEKYSVKGERIVAISKAIEVLSCLNPQRLVGEVAAVVVAAVNDEKYAKIISQPAKDKEDFFLAIAGKKTNFHNKVFVALDLAKGLLDGYGDRANKAASDGMDLKAFYHAVRIGYEAEELLLTGNITFPRPEAPLLLSIRRGEVSYEAVCDIIEAKMADVRSAEAKSTLPESPDMDFIEAFIYSKNLREILNYHTYDYKSEFNHD